MSGLIRLLQKDTEFRQFFYDEHVRELYSKINNLQKSIERYKIDESHYDTVISELEHENSALRKNHNGSSSQSYDHSDDYSSEHCCENINTDFWYGCFNCSKSLCIEHCGNEIPGCNICHRRHGPPGVYLCSECSESDQIEIDWIRCFICNKIYKPNSMKIKGILCTDINQEAREQFRDICNMPWMHGMVCDDHSVEKIQNDIANMSVDACCARINAMQ